MQLFTNNKRKRRDELAQHHSSFRRSSAGLASAYSPCQSYRQRSAGWPGRQPYFDGHRSRAGITLIEIVLVIGISAIILVTVTRFVGTTSLLGNMINQKLQASQDLELALQSVTTDIRSMGQSSAGAYPIESAATNSLIFYSDINENGLFDRVRYTITSSTLQKGVVAPTGNPLTYVTSTEVVSSVITKLKGASSSFAYYDSGYTGTATTSMPLPIDLLALRVIELTLVADVSTSSAPGPQKVVQTVTIRNLRSN